jgi:bifunctional UDP-N-acetylglucosamine pyrophosphorylase/glucosamine-1-phosphate N-acetyltransferase
MSSTKAKVLHDVAGKPMLYHVIRNALSIGSEKILIVVGKYKQDIISAMSPLFPGDILSRFVYITQTDAMLDGEVCSLGTGDAIRSCLPYFSSIKCVPTTKVIILSGDVPYIHPDYLLNFSKTNNAIMVSSIKDPSGYGRVFINSDKELMKIVEHSDCNKHELNTNLVNAGIYNLSVELLLETIPNIELNLKKKEFYLTDFYLHTSKPIHCFFLPHIPKNINTPSDLRQINQIRMNIL